MSEETEQLLIDVDRVAGLYGCARQTIWNWEQQKRIPSPAVRRHGYVRWLRSDIINDINRMIAEERVEAST